MKLLNTFYSVVGDIRDSKAKIHRSSAKKKLSISKMEFSFLLNIFISLMGFTSGSHIMIGKHKECGK